MSNCQQHVYILYTCSSDLFLCGSLFTGIFSHSYLVHILYMCCLCVSCCVSVVTYLLYNTHGPILFMWGELCAVNQAVWVCWECTGSLAVVYNVVYSMLAPKRDTDTIARVIGKYSLGGR